MSYCSAAQYAVTVYARSEHTYRDRCNDSVPSCSTATPRSGISSPPFHLGIFLPQPLLAVRSFSQQVFFDFCAFWIWVSLRFPLLVGAFVDLVYSRRLCGPLGKRKYLLNEEYDGRAVKAISSRIFARSCMSGELKESLVVSCVRHACGFGAYSQSSKTFKNACMIIV